MKSTRLFLMFLCAGNSFGQTATLIGRVTDESGALVAGARITVSGPNGLVETAKSGVEGEYSLTNLEPGAWSITAAAPALAMVQPVLKGLGPGIQRLDLRLKIVTVTAQ